jgi:phosphatidylglycerol:prolipoprotein diacylglycerol transferase
MIPYVNVVFPALGPIQVHLFGIFVACGILVGSKLTRDRGVELGLVDEMIVSMITTVLVCGFIFAHVFDVFAYQTAGDNPTLLQWLNPFGGLSSYGGFMGALGGLFYWCKKHKQRVMPYADSLGFGLAAGWTFGRLGCFSAHDHPGLVTTFPLAVQYPSGDPIFHKYLGGFIQVLEGPIQPRHDLGFYEAMWSLVVTLLFLVLKKRGKQPLGLYVGILTTAYAPIRFLLDFLRASDVPGADPRYFGLTPAQYGSIVVFFVGLGLMRWAFAHKDDAEVPATVKVEPKRSKK